MLEELIKKAKSKLARRKSSYLATFNPQSTDDIEVLVDLAKFCRANETTYHADPRIHAVLEGRREVWLRIQHHLQLSQEQLWALYGRKDLE